MSEPEDRDFERDVMRPWRAVRGKGKTDQRGNGNDNDKDEENGDAEQ